MLEGMSYDFDVGGDAGKWNKPFQPANAAQEDGYRWGCQQRQWAEIAEQQRQDWNNRVNQPALKPVSFHSSPSPDWATGSPSTSSGAGSSASSTGGGAAFLVICVLVVALVKVCGSETSPKRVGSGLSPSGGSHVVTPVQPTRDATVRHLPGDRVKHQANSPDRSALLREARLRAQAQRAAEQRAQWQAQQRARAQWQAQQRAQWYAQQYRARSEAEQRARGGANRSVQIHWQPH